jgi:hypothetical protein
MKRALFVLIIGTVLSGLAAAYASALPRAEASAKKPTDVRDAAPGR